MTDNKNSLMIHTLASSSPKGEVMKITTKVYFQTCEILSQVFGSHLVGEFLGLQIWQGSVELHLQQKEGYSA